MQLTVDSGQLPVGWEIKKLSEVYDVRDGTHESPKYLPEGYALITSKNLKNSGLSFDNIKYISEQDYKKINERSAVHKGDILLAMIGTIGNPIVVDVEPEFAIKNVALIKVTQNQSSYFLKYYLETEYVQSKMQREAKGTTQKFVGLGYLRDFPIVIPPISEQKRIVAILDEAFEGIDRAIANTEKNLANSREVFESYLNAIFTQKGDGWEERKLGGVCKVKDGTHFSPKNSEDGKYMYITAKNIKPYYIDLTKITFISEEDHQKIYSRCPVKKGDVLYIKDGATAGIAAINNFEEEFSLLSSVAVFKTSSQILNTYLVHYANSKLGRKNFLGYIDGAAITRLTLTKLNNVFIPVPLLCEQQKIVTKLDELSVETQRLEAIYRQKIAALKELKQSILQKAFTGELTADTPKTEKEEIAA